MDTFGKLLAVVGIALALLVGVGVYVVVNNAQGAVAETTPVVVAARQIPDRTLFTASNVPTLLTTRTLPSDAVPLGAARNPAEVIGKATLLALLPGEVVIDLPDRLVSGEGTGARPSASIPRDKVALAISTSESMSLAGALQPGDRVDVIATWTTGANQPIAQAIFPDVRVFAVGRRLDDARGRTVTTGTGGASGPGEAPGTVTLLLDPQQAVTTQYLLQNGGSITLALRRFDQAGDLSSEPVTGDTLTPRRAQSSTDGAAAAFPTAVTFPAVPTAVP